MLPSAVVPMLLPPWLLIGMMLLMLLLPPLALLPNLSRPLIALPAALILPVCPTSSAGPVAWLSPSVLWCSSASATGPSSRRAE
jgi:hypothetical protein